MKKFPILLAIIIYQLSIINLRAQDINGLETFEKAMKVGTVLTYDVNSGGKKYQFIATIKKYDSEISFGWKMTEPVNKSGTVNMNTAAVAKAEALFNYFNGGVSNLDKETSVFISRKIFSDVAANASANMKVNGASDTATVLSNTISEFNFNINGELVNVPGWELQGGSEIKYTIDVIESEKFPLIVRMDLGWTIALSEIKSQ